MVSGGHLAGAVCLAALIAASTAAWADGAAAHAGRTLKRAPLDLRAPPLNHLLSMRQIAALTRDYDESAPESITIHGRRDTPACCGTFVAVPWAVRHPRQAWRIFAPLVGACPGTWCTEHPAP